MSHGLSSHPVGALVLSVLGMLLASGASSAQEVTGTLYGRVIAEDGALLPGARMTITSAQLIQAAETRLTNEQGAYRVPMLPPGVYTVKIEMDGFQTVTRENIRLEAGVSLAVDFTLKLAAVAENVTVVGGPPLVDVKSSQTIRTLDLQTIENKPTGRFFTDLILTAPGVVADNYERAPVQSVQGQSVRNNLYNVDGAHATDDTVGYSVQNVNFDAIEEIQVTTAGISAEYGQATGAVFNFITKSGGNTFHGQGNIFYQSDSLQSGNLTPELRAQGLTQGSRVVKNRDIGFNLGGPIKRGKVWFFTNYTNNILEKTQAEFTAAVPRIDDQQGFVKITAQPTRRVTLVSSFTDRTYIQDPANASFTTNNDRRTWDRLFAPHKLVHLGSTTVVNDSTVIEARMSWSATRFDRQFQQLSGYSDVVTGLLSGGYTDVQGKFRRRDNTDIKASISNFRQNWLGGTHNLKAGFEALYNPSLRYASIPGAMLQLLSNGTPYRIRLYNTPNLAGTNYTIYAAYVQDEWTLARFTISPGMRFESSESWRAAQQSGGGPWGFPVISFPEQRNLIKWHNLSPRLGLAWDIRGDHRSSTKFGYARYYESERGGLNPNAPGYQEYDWTDRNGDGAFQAGEQGTLRQDLLPSHDFYDPNIRRPYVDAFHAEMDWQLGNSFVLSMAGVYKRERDITGAVDVTRPFTAYNPINVTNPLNGQPLTIYALNPAFQSVQRVQMLTNPTDPVVLRRDYKGVEITARRRMRNRLQFSGSLNLGSSKGNVGNNFSGRSAYLTPNDLINDYGPLALDAPVQIKIDSTYSAKGGVTLSAYYSGISGYPVQDRAAYDPTTQTERLGASVVRFTRAQTPGIVAESFIDVAGEPRGTRRFDFRNLLSFRAEKQFKIAHWKLELIGDVFNTLNISTVTAVQSLRLGIPQYLVPSIIETPRALRLGVRLSF